MDFPRDYSTLEAAHPFNPHHSTLEPLYYSPNHEVKTTDGAHLPPYIPNDGDLSAKEVFHTVNSNPDDVAGRHSNDGFMKRRVCGMSMKIALLVAGILLLLVIGASVGGAVAGTRSKKDASTSQAPASTTSSGPSISPMTSPTSTSTISSPTPSSSVICPEFNTLVRSDYWYYVYNGNFKWNVFLKGSYDDITKNSAVNAVTLESESFSSKMKWQFQKLDTGKNPLAQLGCTDDFKERLYKIACRDTEPNINIRLGLDMGTWNRYNQSLNTTKQVLRLNLAPDASTDLSQIWYIYERSETLEGRTKEWYEMYNFLSGKEWRLAMTEGDAQPYMDWDGGSVYMRLNANASELIEEPWFGY